MMSIGLRPRGLIVVAVPLLLQIVLFVWIGSLLAQSEDEVMQLSQKRTNVIRLHRLVWETVDGIFQMHINADTKNYIDNDTTSAERAKFQRRIQTVLADSWTPEQKEHIGDLSLAAKQMLNCLDWVEQQQKMGPAHWKVVNSQCYDDVYRLTLAFINSVDSILTLEESQLAPEETDMKQSKESLATILNWSIPVYVLVCLILIAFYVHGVLSPLKRVFQNSKLLSERETLLPALKGDDEISKLDRLLHSVSDSMHESYSKEVAMLENASDIVCCLDAKLNFKIVNSYAQRVFLLSREDLIGQNFLDFVGEDDRKRVDEALNQTFLNQETVTFEARFHTVDRLTLIDGRCSTFWSKEQGKFFCVIRDITEEKNIVRLKQDYLDMISHDLRSPLMSIRGSMTLIAEGAKGPASPALKKDMNELCDNVDLLMTFVNDLLEFQRMQSASFELEVSSFQLDETIAEVAALVAPLAETKSIDVRLPDGTWQLNADKQKVTRAFLNILSNAIKFSPEQSSVSVRVDQDWQSIELSVADRGPGVEPEERERIFDAFQQVASEKAKEGTGLGLAISKLVVEKHGGSIGVRPGDDEVGSIFWIRFPKA